MPIKPENKKLYPKNWKQIRNSILERAENMCEGRIQRGKHTVPCCCKNNSIGYRDKDGNFIELDGYSDFECAENDGEKIIQIVLTIAHLDHDPTNNKPSNLRALCQKCHNKHDGPHRAETRRKSKVLPLLSGALLLSACCPQIQLQRIPPPTAYMLPGDFSCEAGDSVCDCLSKLNAEGKRMNANLGEIEKFYEVRP